MKKYAIVVAGGSGQRMSSSIPKQFLKINNEIILMKSIRAFYNYDRSINIITALPKNQIEYWRNLCVENNFKIDHKVVSGGETRFHSVKNALKEISTDGIVAIHDGVRPLVSQETIDNVFEIAITNESAIPYMDSIDSIRVVDSLLNKPIDRDKIKLIQTPQAFDCKLIKDAYEQDWEETFTDDASVFEKTGKQINLVPGNKENIKITNQVDLLIAEALSSYLSA
jgi:2-C-methyl-D-erythritol 4-phosphate cytidylyltransferase